uniref:Putative coupling protein, TraD n=1 Tax=Polaromonas sp. W5N TaxID=1840315 RepID=A0A2S1FIN1_9BURK|nr:conjugal transfer protein TraD [Polaromonas sp. W5N]AWD72378.1 putative coupling protein, TraD [Polaromonas sp. W5N]
MTADTNTKPQKQDWLSNHLLFLKGLKSPTEAQQLLILLAVKQEKTQKEQKTFDALVKSEKASEKAKEARIAVSSILAASKKAANEAEESAASAARKARNHGLIKLGLLFDYAGLSHLTREELLGLLIKGAKTDRVQVREWSVDGAAMLAVKEPVKAAPVPDNGY